MRKGGTNRALQTCIFGLDVSLGPKVERHTGNGRQKFQGIAEEIVPRYPPTEG